MSLLEQRIVWCRLVRYVGANKNGWRGYLLARVRNRKAEVEVVELGSEQESKNLAVLGGITRRIQIPFYEIRDSNS